LPGIRDQNPSSVGQAACFLRFDEANSRDERYFTATDIELELGLAHVSVV